MHYTHVLLSSLQLSHPTLIARTKGRPLQKSYKATRQITRHANPNTSAIGFPVLSYTLGRNFFPASNPISSSGSPISRAFHFSGLTPFVILRLVFSSFCERSSRYREFYCVVLAVECYCRMGDSLCCWRVLIEELYGWRYWRFL